VTPRGELRPRQLAEQVAAIAAMIESPDVRVAAPTESR
jgi:hypothetical protein